MKVKRIISIHPRLAAVFDLLFSLVAIWWLLGVSTIFPVIVWFFVRLAWWSGLVNSAYYPPYISRYKHYLSLSIFHLGAISYLIFSDQSNLLITKILVTLIPAISFWLIPSKSDSLSVMEKPHRRWKFFLSLFGVSGVWLTIFATTTFQIISDVQIIYAIMAGSLLTTAIGVWEWFDYGLKINSKTIIHAAILTLCIFEFASITFLWPIGYFVNSFFVTWVWYITWLLFRFDLSDSGINWSKQKIFIISSVLLIIIYLFTIARWK
jgi:hypothetical protein